MVWKLSSLKWFWKSLWLIMRWLNFWVPVSVCVSFLFPALSIYGKFYPVSLTKVQTENLG